MQHELANFTSGDAATVLGIATVGTGLGKIQAMMTVARFGARRTYLFAQIALATFVCLLSLSNAVWLVALCTFSMEFAAGPSWPAHAVIVRGWWPTDMLPSAFWVLSLASRGSDMGSKLLYGALLNVGVPWRWLLRLASCGAIIGAFLSRWHRDTHQQEGAADVMNSDANAQKQLRTFVYISNQRKFWIAGITMLLLTCVKKSGQLTSVYFRDVTNQTILSDGGAAGMGVVFQMGLMSSVLVFGKLYEKLVHDRHRIMLCISLVGMSSLCGLLLALDGGEVSSSVSLLVWRAALVFFVAVGVGLTYYVPMGVFSVQFGKENTALVSAYLDLLGYLMSATFLSMVLRPAINSGGGWSTAWYCLAFVSLIGSVAALIFLRMLLFDVVDVWPFGSRRHGGEGDETGQYAMI